MYDAVTRSTYAELFKTAEAHVREHVSSDLVKIAARVPAVKDALVEDLQAQPEGASR
jgi:hypothetical protein